MFSEKGKIAIAMHLTLNNVAHDNLPIAQFRMEVTLAIRIELGVAKT